MTTEFETSERMPNSYAKSRTPENWENKRKWRNIVTKERRKAIKEHWRLKTEEMAIKLRQFFQTFKPFISNKCKEEKYSH